MWPTGRFVAPLLAVLAAFAVLEASCQENAIRKLSQSLVECYESELYEKWRLLPQNMNTLISIIRKIENHPGLNMDLRTLSAALLHRFRQDGIEHNPQVKVRDGILPFAVSGEQFFRHSQNLRVIPGNAIGFPNDSISALERCSLHAMLSSSVDIYERGDENTVCKYANYAYRRYRRIRSPLTQDRAATAAAAGGSKDEVETLTAEQLELMSASGGEVEPSSYYADLPAKHPRNAARLAAGYAHSRCPTENGVVKTPWGTVSGGALLAGIAAGLEPQTIRIGDLIRRQVERRELSYPDEAQLDNKFLATLAGDLAEVAIVQGPQKGERYGERYKLGADGNWNSSSRPRYYFLNQNENLQMTAAEIRGGLDGLILGKYLPDIYNQVRNLKLYQVLDMYYSNQGLTRRNVRACNRRSHLINVAPNSTLVSQTHSAAILLSTGLSTATMKSDTVLEFAQQAVADLSTFIPTMNQDNNCDVERKSVDVNEMAVNITIIIDTSWPFEQIEKILGDLLEGLDIGKHSGSFSLMNAKDGSVMLQSTDYLLDFYVFNSTEYNKYQKGLDLQQTLEKLRNRQMQDLNDAQRNNWGGGKSSVVLFVPYQSYPPQNEKDYINDALIRMREGIPDSVHLYLNTRPMNSKEHWTDYVLDPSNDVVTISYSESSESYPGMETLLARIKQVPRRLINSQCGAYYNSEGHSTASVTEYMAPDTTNFYRMHPNYFFSGSSDGPKMKVQSLSSTSLHVCTSRELLVASNFSQPNSPDINCVSVTSGIKELPNFNCDGKDYISDCKPYYIAVTAGNSTNINSCTDLRVCRRPNNVGFKISFENLVCKSGQNTLLVTPVFILIVMSRFIL